MLGIPGVHVCRTGEVDGEVRLWIETSVSAPRCLICDSQLTPDGRELTDLVSTRDGQPVHLVWQRRRWRCSKTSCAVSFVEQGEEIATFQERSPHRGVTLCSSDQSGFPHTVVVHRRSVPEPSKLLCRFDPVARSR